MAKARIREEDLVGVVLAVAAHAALLAWLVFAPRPEAVPPPERVTVTLDGIVAPEAGSPSREQAAQAVAPEIAPEPAAPAPAPAPSPLPQPIAKTVPPPLPRTLPTPPPRPAPRAQATPPRPQPRPAPPAPQRKAIGSDFLGTTPAKKPGGGKIGPNFLPGASAGSPSGKAATPPGPALTPQVRASLAMAISRQLKPKWAAPQGADAELLVTYVAWDLNLDGSLAGAPRVLRQEGITDANRAQAQRHAEQAIRAVRLAAPFDLPPEFYGAWKRITSFRFDRKLSQ